MLLLSLAGKAETNFICSFVKYSDNDGRNENARGTGGGVVALESHMLRNSAG